VQTSRELVNSLLKRENTDRAGLFDTFWGDTLEGWESQGYPLDENGHRVDPVDHFGFDMCGVGGWFDILPLRGFWEVLEETDEWRVTRNGAGAALKYWKHRSGTPEHIDFKMTSRAVWEKDYRPHLLEVDRKRVGIEGTRKALAKRREQGLWTFYGHVFIWENMRQSMGDMCMYESLITDPDWIHDYNRVYTDFFKAHFKLLIEEAGKPDGIWLYEDLGYRNGLFCSPKTLEDLILPYFRELVDFFHSYDLPVVLHTCGGIEAALPLIVEAGFDALNPMEVKSGCDVLRFAERYGDRLVFVGGMDARIFESGDRDLIRSEVIRLMDGMKSIGAGFLFGSDHSISTNVSYADYQYAVEVYREYM